MGDQEQVSVRVEQSISSIDEKSWDALANPNSERFNPFVCHAFLNALEESGAVCAETGWHPQHLLLLDNDGGAQGAMPCYLKSHSQGEYVFDHNWADAYERAGGDYYPKLQSAIPFTPVTGPRLLVPDCPDAEHRRTILAHAASQLAARHELSSLHITFPTKQEWDELGALGFLKRKDQQFHWLNRNYETFDEFLESLASRKRKAIRKERREALENDVTIERITGSDITEAHWDAFFEFYIDTSDRKWGRPYLNRDFFSRVSEKMSDRILLIMCRRQGNWIAGALNFIGGDTLFGRYWGAIEHHNRLHFEVCYYQAIDFAIERKLSFVEAGAQGTHKLARGYLPTETYSAHFILDPGLHQAIENFLQREGIYADMEKDALMKFSPFKKT